MRDPHYGQMCFKSLGSPHSFLAVEKASVPAFSTAKNVVLLGLYRILIHDFLFKLGYLLLSVVIKYM